MDEAPVKGETFHEDTREHPTSLKDDYHVYITVKYIKTTDIQMKIRSQKWMNSCSFAKHGKTRPCSCPIHKRKVNETYRIIWDRWK